MPSHQITGVGSGLCQGSVRTSSTTSVFSVEWHKGIKCFGLKPKFPQPKPEASSQLSRVALFTIAAFLASKRPRTLEEPSANRTNQRGWFGGFPVPRPAQLSFIIVVPNYLLMRILEPFKGYLGGVLVHAKAQSLSQVRWLQSCPSEPCGHLEGQRCETHRPGSRTC